MAFRYLRWRTPDGRTAPRTDGKHSPVRLLAEVGSSSHLDAEGNVAWSYPGFSPEDRPTVCAMAAIVDHTGRQLNQTDADTIAHRAISKVIKASGGGKPIAVAAFEKEVDRSAAEFFRQPTNRFILSTSLSVTEIPFASAVIEDCVVRRRPKRGILIQEPESLTRRRTSRPELPHFATQDYQQVLVDVEARTSSEAVDKAIGALTLLKALWNFAITFQSRRHSFGRPDSNPLAAVFSGPLFTIHNEDGTPASDGYWSDLDFVRASAVFKPHYGWTDIESFRRKTLRRLRSSPIKQDIIELLARYTAALEAPLMDLAFLQLWGVLEAVTDSVGENYDTTIRRASWFYKDRKIVEERLQCFRLQRNRFVHAGKGGLNDEIAQSLKSVVDSHLIRLIGNAFKVSSKEEYGRLLDLPSNPGTLRDRRHRIQQALKLFGKS